MSDLYHVSVNLLNAGGQPQCALTEIDVSRNSFKSVSGRSDRTFERAKQSAISAVKSVAKMALSNSRY
ncbi:hypothetical protein H6G00_09465 [Leptolyngbya sp. FACHB-541]|uniref:hypothetical protein n=1 Tax=Leptolyngbya sp. FACHB-541 TaxID=2692810 RepID=UPI00168731FB|nr:hypothetical protein [Leptolyngbya sp. FACHB-541]MBD1996846.1 hypothetical protein [Leptolyngbya sp. FACHB-541]